MQKNVELTHITTCNNFIETFQRNSNADMRNYHYAYLISTYFSYFGFLLSLYYSTGIFFPHLKGTGVSLEKDLKT
jgi:hypothetical protein